MKTEFNDQPTSEGMRRSLGMSPPSERDWVEDFEHENGNYQNQCSDCGKVFIGHKRRLICKACTN